MLIKFRLQLLNYYRLMHQQWKQVGFKKQVKIEDNVPVTLTYLSKTSKFEPKKNQNLQLNHDKVIKKMNNQKSLLISIDDISSQKSMCSPRIRAASPGYNLRNFLTPTSKNSRMMFGSQNKNQKESLLEAAKGVHKSIEGLKQQINSIFGHQLQKINNLIKQVSKISCQNQDIRTNEINAKKYQLQQTLKCFKNVINQVNMASEANNSAILAQRCQIVETNPYKTVGGRSIVDIKNCQSSNDLISLSANPQAVMENLKFKRISSLTLKQAIKKKGDKVFR